MSTAQKVAEHKAKHPKWYCPAANCLWRTRGNYTPCPRHQNFYDNDAPYKSQARRIADMYNATARAEARPDLEEE